MARRIVDLVFTVAVFVGSIYLWFVADQFPKFLKYKNVDSDFWPKIILATMAILSLFILYENIVSLRLQRKEAKSTASHDDDQPVSRVQWKTVISMGVLCIVYYWGLSLLGFIIATMIFMWLAFAVIGGAKKWIAVVFPLIFTMGLALVFVKVLELSLPRGVWLFRDLSLLFY
jgi:hypothetical protein